MEHSKATQRRVVLDLLEKRGPKGVGSFERIKLGILQMPTRIYELKRLGYNIGSYHKEGSREVIYVLNKWDEKSRKRTYPGNDHTFFKVHKRNEKVREGS